MGSFRAWLTAGLLLLAPPAYAQTAAPPPASSPVLTLDQERLYADSAWGKRATQHLSAESERLAAENRELEAKLVAEEKALTDARPTMDPEAFRAAADAFDARVVELRRRQDAKGRAIGRISEAERQAFYKAALPAMGEVLRRRGAVVVLDSRAIFVSVESIDVTKEMIEVIDASIGAGTDAADPAPEPTPPPADGGAN
jgi:Skp family chaperone for outer membrane proteins